MVTIAVGYLGHLRRYTSHRFPNCFHRVFWQVTLEAVSGQGAGVICSTLFGLYLDRFRVRPWRMIG